jgi:ABC-type nickel/cobalt efflux system permease component RcnA
VIRASRLLVAGAALALLILWPGAANAHPLGNFTVNVYDGIRLTPGLVRLVHVVDMAEIPTFQELRRVDEDGSPSDEALAAWADDLSRDARRELTVSVDGDRVSVRLEAVSAGLRPGQGGLPTLRLEAIYAGVLPRTGTLEFRDGTFPGRLGWREVTAAGAGGVALGAASVPAGSLSDELRSYPQDMLSTPPSITGATVSFRPGLAPPDDPGFRSDAKPEGAPRAVDGGMFADLASRGTLTPSLVVLSLILAVGFGALHAMGPGHGKTIMAAYLVGGGRRIRHAVGVAGAVAAMHTAAVVGLGAIVLSVERAFPAERLYPWLGLLSGGAAVALGGRLLVVRGANQRGHRHQHDRSAAERPLSPGGLMALALSGGVLPSPTTVVALLASIALGRTAFGLALVGAFSLGLAAALAGVGMLAVGARSLMAPRLGRWGRLLPLGSASAITMLGAVLVVRATLQLS